MVRLETIFLICSLSSLFSFTFQYGQIRNVFYTLFRKVHKFIYIPVWLDQKLKGMDGDMPFCLKFTFQYGQIRNIPLRVCRPLSLPIYIPVWLDQKPIVCPFLVKSLKNLHSSMVRLETCKKHLRARPLARIYIPVWLDQKQSPLCI